MIEFNPAMKGLIQTMNHPIIFMTVSIFIGLILVAMIIYFISRDKAKGVIVDDKVKNVYSNDNINYGSYRICLLGISGVGKSENTRALGKYGSITNEWKEISFDRRIFPGQTAATRVISHIYKTKNANKKGIDYIACTDMAGERMIVGDQNNSDVVDKTVLRVMENSDIILIVIDLSRPNSEILDQINNAERLIIKYVRFHNKRPKVHIIATHEDKMIGEISNKELKINLKRLSRGINDIAKNRNMIKVQIVNAKAYMDAFNDLRVSDENIQRITKSSGVPLLFDTIYNEFREG